MTAPATAQLLAEARAKIDQIDDRIFELLRERALIVGDVAEAKRKAGEDCHSSFRPEREAQILRRLHRNASEAGGPDFEGLARIWREIMAAGLWQQSSVAVGVPQIAGERGLELRRIAREQFGGGCQIQVYPALGALYVAVRKDPNLIGILPSLSAYLSLSSGQSDVLPIIASLPFWSEDAGSRAFAFGHVRLAPSGDDVTLVSVSLQSGVGTRGCSVSLAAKGISAAHCASSGSRVALSIDGFWAEGKPREALNAALHECCSDWALVGAYARPLAVGRRQGNRS